MEPPWYKASINLAHAGAGKDNGDKTVYIQAPDLLAAWSRARRYPGAKKSRRGQIGNGITPTAVDLIPRNATRWYWRERRPRKGGICYMKPPPDAT